MVNERRWLSVLVMIGGVIVTLALAAGYLFGMMLLGKVG